MRKIYLFLLIVFAIGLVYFLIPARIKIARQTRINENDGVAFAFLSDSSRWKNWDHGSEPSQRSIVFRIRKIIFPRIFIEAETAGTRADGLVEIIPLPANDSCMLAWEFGVASGSTPWKKLSRIVTATKIKDAFSQEIEAFVRFITHPENVYGIPIAMSQVKDTTVATISMFSRIQPNDSLVCRIMDSLRRMTLNAGLTITGAAMIHTQQEEERGYRVMVGLPVNKDLNAPGKFIVKKLVPGKLLITNIAGGPFAVRKGLLQMKKYILDHSIEEAAIPYEVPLTNRCAERDTSKWKTRICYPVF